MEPKDITELAELLLPLIRKRKDFQLKVLMLSEFFLEED